MMVFTHMHILHLYDGILNKRFSVHKHISQNVSNLIFRIVYTITFYNRSVSYFSVSHTFVVVVVLLLLLLFYF